MSAILYSFRRCPYAMRARMALSASGAPYEHREILLSDKPSSMLRASPKGTVPVFVRQDGSIIDESLDLMHWALTQNDPLGYLDCDIDTAHDLIQTNDGPFKHNLDRYKYASRYKADAKRGDVDLTHREAAEEFIKTLENSLSHKSCLLGENPSLADIAIFPFIRQFANTDREWWDGSSYEHTKKWLERHTNSPLFLGIMTKHALWKEPTLEADQSI